MKLRLAKKVCRSRRPHRKATLVAASRLLVRAHARELRPPKHRCTHPMFVLTVASHVPSDAITRLKDAFARCSRTDFRRPLVLDPGVRAEVVARADVALSKLAQVGTAAGVRS
jgi:hypothetical protein